MGLRLRAAVLLVAALAGAGPAQAQSSAPASARSDLLYWVVNAGVATVSGWLQGRTGRQPLRRAVLGGLAGGTLVYTGQRIVGTGHPRLRVVGLETVAVGASVTRNIALGAPPLSELNLVLYPFYVRLRPHATTRVSVRVSMFGLIQALRTGLRYDTWPDPGQSLQTGAPVFAIEGETLKCMSPACTFRAVGQHRYGNFAYAIDGDACLRHETLHLVQDVRDAGLHALPASDWTLERAGPVGRWLSRYVVLDGFLPLSWLGSDIAAERFDPSCRGLGTFTECEATSLSHNH